MSKYRVAIPPALKLFLKDNPFFRRSCVYKFHHSQHCKSIFENGTIKIGRSSDYRSIEKETLKDAYEGVEWTGFHDHKATKLSDLDRRSGVHRVLSGAGSLQALSVMAVNADLYIYCFSYENSKKVLESFRDEEPYDSVAVCADIFSVAEIVCEHHPLLSVRPER